jgi:hypothetical protein
VVEHDVFKPTAFEGAGKGVRVVLAFHNAKNVVLYGSRNEGGEPFKAHVETGNVISLGV